MTAIFTDLDGNVTEVDTIHTLPDGRVVKFKTGDQIMRDLRKRRMTAETLRKQTAAAKRRNAHLTTGLYVEGALKS